MGISYGRLLRKIFPVSLTSPRPVIIPTSFVFEMRGMSCLPTLPGYEIPKNRSKKMSEGVNTYQVPLLTKEGLGEVLKGEDLVSPHKQLMPNSPFHFSPVDIFYPQKHQTQTTKPYIHRLQPSPKALHAQSEAQPKAHRSRDAQS